MENIPKLSEHSLVNKIWNQNTILYFHLEEWRNNKF